MISLPFSSIARPPSVCHQQQRRAATHGLVLRVHPLLNLRHRFPPPRAGPTRAWQRASAPSWVPPSDSGAPLCSASWRTGRMGRPRWGAGWCADGRTGSSCFARLRLICCCCPPRRTRMPSDSPDATPTPTRPSPQRARRCLHLWSTAAHRLVTLRRGLLAWSALVSHNNELRLNAWRLVRSLLRGEERARSLHSDRAPPLELCLSAPRSGSQHSLIQLGSRQ